MTDIPMGAPGEHHRSRAPEEDVMPKLHVEDAALTRLFARSPELKESVERVVELLVKHGVVGAREGLYAILVKTMAQAKLMADAGPVPPAE